MRLDGVSYLSVRPNGTKPQTGEIGLQKLISCSKHDHTEIAIQSRFRAETMTPSYAITERMKSVTRPYV